MPQKVQIGRLYLLTQKDEYIFHIHSLEIFTQPEVTADISNVMAHKITQITKYHMLFSTNLTTMHTYGVAEYNIY